MAFSTFNSIQSFLVYVNQAVSSGLAYVYNYPSLDPSMVLYYPLDISATIGTSRGTPNYGSLVSGVATYDASMVGTGALISNAGNTFITGLGDLSLNNTMGGTATNYVDASNSFVLNPSGGLTISVWFSTAGVAGKVGTLVYLLNYSLNPTVLTNGLVMHFPFDTNKNDSISGSNYSMIGSATISSTNPVPAIGTGCLNCTSSHLRSNGFNLSLTQLNSTSLSISSWILFPNALTTTSIFWAFGFLTNNIFIYLINRRSTLFNSNTIITLAVDINNRYMNFNILNGFTTNIWYHIVVTIINSTLNIYLNGTLLNNMTMYNGDALETGPSSNYVLISSPVGVSYSGLAFGSAIGGALQSNCYLDDFRFYNRILSPSEITTIYSKTNNKGIEIDISGTNQICSMFN